MPGDCARAGKGAARAPARMARRARRSWVMTGLERGFDLEADHSAIAFGNRYACEAPAHAGSRRRRVRSRRPGRSDSQSPTDDRGRTTEDGFKSKGDLRVKE